MDDELAIEQSVRAALTQALAGTGYLPADGFVTDAVAVIGYVDASGDHCWSMVRAGSPWATRGLVVMAGDATDGDWSEMPED
jgi:hypothetical protein